MTDERDEVMRADDVADLDPYGVRKPPVQQQAEELLGPEEEPPSVPIDESEDILPPGTWTAPAHGAAPAGIWNPPLPKPDYDDFFKEKMEEKQIKNNFKESFFNNRNINNRNINTDLEKIIKESKDNYIKKKEY